VVPEGSGRPAAAAPWYLRVGPKADWNGYGLAMTEASNVKRRWMLIMLAIVAVSGLGIGMYFGSAKADVERRCRDDCALLVKSGVMVPALPGSSTAGMRGTGPAQCKCE